MIRRRADIDDLDSLFDQAEVERRKAIRAEIVETARVRAEQIKEQETAQRAAAVASMNEANAAFVLREYQHAGVEPPKVDGNGNPTCSLELLLRLGWRIEDVEGVRTLIKPLPPPKYVARGECT